MKFAPKKPPTPADHRLAEAQATKAAATEEMEAARVVLSRLETAARAPAPIQAELAMLDKDESAAMAQWSADPDAGSPPIPDAERRVDLQKRLVVAEAQARAATGAMSGPRAAMNAAGARAAAAQRAEWIARKLMSIEAAEGTLQPLAAAIRQIYECKRKVDAAREGILANLRHADGDVGEVFTALAAFDRKRHEAEAIPLSELIPPEGIVPDGEHQLARALAQLGPVGPWLDVGAPAQSGPQQVDPSRILL